MKPLLFQFLFFLIITNSFSQNTRFNKQDDSLITNAQTLEYNLEGLDRTAVTKKLPFSKLTFYDVRYDTSFIAINWQTGTGPGLRKNIQNRKLNLERGLAPALTEYLNFYFNNNFSGNAEIICYIKNFYVGLKDTTVTNKIPREIIRKFRFETECYYKRNDSLFPAIRIDTSYAVVLSDTIKTWSAWTKDIFRPLIKRLEDLDTSKILKRKSYGYTKIYNKYQNRFNLPILTTSEYRKGVYKNFKEFVNNMPSITLFTIKKEKYMVTLYDANGDIIPKAFGFSDGDDCWLFGGAFCSKLIRVGNGFEFFYTLYIVGDLFTPTRKYLLSLNMETGKID